MTTRRRRLWLAAAVLATVVALANASRLAPAPPRRWRFLAHRGVHQTFALDGVDDATCTATRIGPPTHRFLENTLPSMEAAFAAGADTVELDVHVSRDGVPMVFHDATLDCRTDGHGAPEERTAAELRRLDLGWGYSADGGRTFPLRGAGVGLMPSLDEVLAALPGRAILLHFKSDRAADGDLVGERLARLAAADRARVSVYGGAAPSARVTARLPDVRGFDKRRLTSCLVEYELFGWTGLMPGPCRHTLVVVPINHAGKLWGWPRRFEARLRAVGSEVILVGPTSGGHLSGIDDAATLARVPDDFGGLVWTNRIEALGRQQER
jgi:glycerophosphoryl diester phosphodiesterase